MDIEQMKVGFMDVFCYLVACPRSKEALVIDPAGNEDRVVERVREKNLDLRYIVNTHGHPDHICGNAKVKALTGAKIIMHELDDQMLSSAQGQEMERQWGFAPSPPADITVKDDDQIHSLNHLLRHIGFMGPEATSKGLGNMHQFMDQYLGLLFLAELIKPFRDNLNDIMRLLVEG